jgi:hypothetical protein
MITNIPEFSLERTFKNRDLLLQTGSQFFNPPNKISNKKIASSAIFPLLIIIFIRKNDPERVRTVDLRRDRAAL